MALASAVRATDKKVACVGNSITYGYGLSSPYYESYPTQLDTLLGTGYGVSNFGVSGKTMIKAVNDAYWTQSAFTSARAYLPDLVVIELGTNDSKDYIWPYYKQNFKADYAAMVDTFRVLSSNPDVWVTLQPPANNPSWNMYDTTIDRQVNPAILDVAKQKGLSVIDLHTAMKGHGEWMQDDSVHPNAAGAKALAGIVAGKLSTAVKILLFSPACIGCTSSLRASTQSTAYGYWWYRNDTLLAKDTLQGLPNPTKAGRYRVSVKVENAGESRVVSPEYVLAHDLVGIGRRRSNPLVRIVPGVSGSLQVESSAVLGPVILSLWDARGELVANGNLKPGVYHYRAQGRDFQNVGSVVVSR